MSMITTERHNYEVAVIAAKSVKGEKSKCPALRRRPGYTCSSMCGFCHGTQEVMACVRCEGCGIFNSVICRACNGRGLKPVPLLFKGDNSYKGEF